jgi:FkbM family methyltransferase
MQQKRPARKRRSSVPLANNQNGNPMKRTYKGWFGDFTLDPDIDFYGDKYWQSIANKTYEPDTMGFLESNLNSSTDFVDVGAATGAMSIIAGKLGARVLSFEAVPRVFEIANAHIDNNPEIAGRVIMRNNAISSHPGTLKLGENTDSKVLSSISNEKVRDPEKANIGIVSLGDEIDSFHDRNNNLVIKIDIEGAEWKLLSDKETLEGLSRHRALVLLAIHPGFDRPFKVLPMGLTIFTKKYWQLQNFFVAFFFSEDFSRLPQLEEPVWIKSIPLKSVYF